MDMESRGFRLAQYERLRLVVSLYDKELRAFVKAVDGWSVGEEAGFILELVQARNIVKLLRAYEALVEYVDNIVGVEIEEND